MRQYSPQSGLSSSIHWGVGGDIITIMIIILCDSDQSGLCRHKAVLIAEWFIEQYSLEGWRYNNNNNINKNHFIIIIRRYSSKWSVQC